MSIQQQKKPKILFVDDEPNVLASLQRTMRKQIFEILVTDSPKEALNLLLEVDVSVLVSDYHMPWMDGRNLLQLVRLRHPNLPCIMLSGYLDDPTLCSFRKDSPHVFLSKPHDGVELIHSINLALRV